MAGAKQIMTAQAINSNNLANASTTGFRADMRAFHSVPVYGPALPSRVYAVTDPTGLDLRPGPLVSTGRELDVAVEGEGYIAVQTADGKEAYTRAGDLRMTAEGLLTTGAGHPVLGSGGPIAIPLAEKIEIGRDGTVSLRPVGQAAATLAAADRIKLVNIPAGNVVKGEDGLLHVADGSTPPESAEVNLVSGALEGSNVSAVDAMVNMISLARHFEMAIKSMKTAEENDRAATQVLRAS
jgi:flagellar basal-body rod protein FlgF